MDRFWRILTKSWLLAGGITTAFMYVYNPHESIRQFYLWYLFWSYVAICINMVISRFMQMTLNTYKAPRAAFVGSFEEYEKFNYFLNKTSVKLEEVGYVIDGPMPENKIFNVLGTLDDLESIIRSYEIDQVYFMMHSNDYPEMIEEHIGCCLEMGVTVKMIMDVEYSSQMTRSFSYVSSV
jgi:FlaA1/EpsC-like NDP-sugar epimerase